MVEIEELRTGPLLCGLTEEQLVRVACHASCLRLDEGQLLFSQGDPAERFYLVLKGQVRLFRLSPEGAEKVIEIVTLGQTFAEALMFLNAPRYPVCAAALCPTELIGIDARDFASMLRDSVDSCFVLLGNLSRRLHAMIGEIDNLALHTATSRVARYLLMKLPAGRRTLDLGMRKGVLASRLSVKPETFSRVEKKLIELGAIEVQGSQVTILDQTALEEIARLGHSQELTLMPCASAARPIREQ
ncbi:Crp/Fnr family transcriptional regulator [Candidatus Thiosymbion oneisti]|uniref:Crp/Fnr family transcriptional regulator n=1 Tax=Candidatus Thiosymbion oneisti TaxID=589554 RepID=UPI000AABD2BC|nr:Crp/Fnr family transcriptional regulator [Candidatus Thiosymbion oneisti]